MQDPHKTTIRREDLQHDKFSGFSEIEKSFTSTQGGKFCFKETQFEALQFIQCEYTVVEKEEFIIAIENEVLEMHFLLKGANSVRIASTSLDLTTGNNVLRYQCNTQQQVVLSPVSYGRFFEVRVGREYISRLFGGEGDDTVAKLNHTALTTTPEMYNILAQLNQQTYHGPMKALFMEAKMIELFLLQWHQKQQITSFETNIYSPSDKARIVEAKQMIDIHKDHFLTISQLATMVGINKRKLTQGFKHYFHKTIFQHTTEVKMQHARHLLLDESKPVNEVSDAIGYKNSQHFSTAFKKYFGVSPGSIKG